MSIVQNVFRPLDRSKYGVAISWDRARQEVDLDLQVVCVDSSGSICDAIYHNNLSAMNGAIRHSGDDQGTGSQMVGECVWVDAAKLPMRVKLLIFVVAAASGGHLIDVRRGMISVVKPRTDGPAEVISQYHMENSNGDVDAVVMMKRSAANGAWLVGPIDEPAEEGASFLDIMDVIGKLIKLEIPAAPSEQNVVFRMEKAGDLKSAVEGAMHARSRRAVPVECKAYAVSLIWDGEGAADEAVEVHALVVDTEGYVTDVVNSVNIDSTGGAICLAGDQGQVREREPGQRCLSVDLQLLPEAARLVMFVLTVDQDKGLQALKGYCALVLEEETQKSVARFRAELGEKSGCSMAVLWFYRAPVGDWVCVQSNAGTHEGRQLMEASPHWGGILREYIPEAPASDQGLLRVSLAPGGSLTLPSWAECRTVAVDVRWTLPSSNESVQGLNVAAVLFDDERDQVSASSVTQQRAQQQTGQVGFVQACRAGTSDDFSQKFTLSLAGMGKKVKSIFLVATAVGDGDLEAVTNLECRVTTESGHSLASVVEIYCMSDDAGVLLARLVRGESAAERRASTMSGSPRSPAARPSVSSEAGSPTSAASADSAAGSSPRSGLPRSRGSRTVPRLTHPWTLQALGIPTTGRLWSDNECMRVMRAVMKKGVVEMRLCGMDVNFQSEAYASSGGVNYNFASEDPQGGEAVVPMSSTPFLLLASAAACTETMRLKRPARKKETARTRVLKRAASAFSSQLGGTDLPPKAAVGLRRLGSVLSSEQAPDPDPPTPGLHKVE